MNIFIYSGLFIVIVLLIVVIVQLAALRKQKDEGECGRGFEELGRALRETKYELNSEIKSSRTETNQTVQTSLRSFAELLTEGQKLSAENQDKRLSELRMQLSNMNIENEQRLENIRQMMENLHNHMGSGSLFGDFFGMPGDSTTTNNMPGGFPFGHFLPDEFFNPGEGMTDEDFEEFFKNGNHRQKVEKFFQSFGNGTGMSSNSVQITEENGKTKIKIDSQNSDMTYIIDGQQAPKDNVQMPDKILNVNIIPSKEDVKKSYLFITSRDRLGEFVSFQNGVLTFKYNSQEYKYNLEKMKEPLLVIDGRLADRFDIDPSEILQIRPISPIEKEVGYYPNAEVIINTK